MKGGGLLEGVAWSSSAAAMAKQARGSRRSCCGEWVGWVGGWVWVVVVVGVGWRSAKLENANVHASSINDLCCFC